MTDLRNRLSAIGQEHLLRFADELTADEAMNLRARIESLDPPSWPALIDTYVTSTAVDESFEGIAPPPTYELKGDWDRDHYRSIGEALLKSGKVAAFTVAGGQGSRLGYEGPKGCYPAGPVTGKPLFQVFAEGIVANQRRYECQIPWYIMTGPSNHEATLEFFNEHNHFGLDPSHISFFQQGAMPTFSRQGKVLLAAKNTIATNPDGHGGSYRALSESGSLDDMRARGIEQISYFQVDNPTVRILDPVFLGLHTAAPNSSAEMSSKMVGKAQAEEKVGVFALRSGKLGVVEYSDFERLAPKLMAETDANGTLRFRAGNLAVHIISVEFATRIATDPSFQLPFHRAEKSVPHINLETGDLVRPEDKNAIKLERFVFDALPLAKSSIVLETDRVEEFAPIKSAEGADSPATSALFQTQRAARWLEAAGVEVPRNPDASPNCTLELSPLTALEPEDLTNLDIAPIKPGESRAL